MEHCPCNNVCASRVPIFQGLTPTELARFNEILTTREYSDGTIIYTQGSPARILCIVNSGAVKLFTTSPDGREQILRILQPGDFFGETVLFSEETRAASAQALGVTKICQLDKYQAEEIILSHPEITRKLIASLNLRLIQAEKQIEYLGTRTTLQRVANLLVNLAKDQATTVITLPLGREGLASLTGMTVENFSRKLSELQIQGLISPQGRKKIILKDLRKLEELT